MLEQHGDVLFNGEPAEKPLICVATQTFEVGLDADVTALVTESASATALVQRLGRLNRRGATLGSATIVRDAGSWLYDEDEPAAWDWLQGLAGDDGTIDVSVAALERSTLPQPTRMPRAATLTPEIVELFAQTSPRPESWREPDPDVFLRGAESKPAAEVAVCWRSDLRPDLIDPGADGYRSMLLDLVPPQRQELMTLSLTSARALLAARYPGGGSQTAAARLAMSDADMEDAMPADPAPEPRHDERQRPFLVLRRGEVRRGTLRHMRHSTARGDVEDAAHPIWPGALRPGDIIVLPTSAGGVDEHGLAPLQPRKDAAVDVAADLRPNSALAPVRLTPEALGGGGGQLAAGRWKMVTEACTRAEKEIARAPGAEARQQHVDKLMERLCQTEVALRSRGPRAAGEDSPRAQWLDGLVAQRWPHRCGRDAKARRCGKLWRGRDRPARRAQGRLPTPSRLRNGRRSLRQSPVTTMMPGCGPSRACGCWCPFQATVSAAVIVAWARRVLHPRSISMRARSAAR